MQNIAYITLLIAIVLAVTFAGMFVRHFIWRHIGIAVALIVILFAIGSGLLFLNSTMQQKGYTGKEGITWTQALKAIPYMPDRDDLDMPDLISGSIVIFYRYGCTDCMAVFSDMEDAVSSSGITVYHIPTRSEKGELLRQTVQIPAVPTGVYYGYDGRVYIYPLDKKENGQTVFNTESWEKLMALVLEKR